VLCEAQNYVKLRVWTSAYPLISAPQLSNLLHSKEIRDTREELCEKINLVDFKVETLNQKIDGVRDELGQKIDAVAEDLAAHRRDTEAHPSVYKVKEGK